MWLSKSSVVTLAASSGLFLSLSLAPSLVCAQTAQTAPADNTHQVDNTAQNKAHRQTADQQETGKSDRDITQQVRKAIIADKSLSMYGHNIKIITLNGAVTLRGPVHTAEEKQALMTDAEGVVGSGKVTDRITVKDASAKPSAAN